MNTFDAAMKHVQKKGTYTPNMLKDKPVKNWINDTYSVLKKGVDAGIANNVVPDEMAAHLDHDTFLFSGFKVHAALEQAKLRLRNNDGSIKSFEKFRQDVDVIDARYNRQYLQAEYQFAISSSQSAANWTQVAEDGDAYNLQYRTAGDEAVRESHRALNGITLPSSDPFWDKFYPPNGWRCRCDAVQVRKSKHPVTDSNKAQKAGAKATTQINRKGQNKLAIFRFNPGKEQKIFPPKHPYYKASDVSIKEVTDIANTKAKYKETLEYGKREIIGKLEVENEAFGNRKARFVKNSFTENLGYGNLFDTKADILRNINQYLPSYKDKLEFKKNNKLDKKPDVVGYFVYKTIYNGNVSKYHGDDVDILFEDRGKDGIVFYFIKFIKKEKAS